MPLADVGSSHVACGKILVDECSVGTFFWIMLKIFEYNLEIISLFKQGNQALDMTPFPIDSQSLKIAFLILLKVIFNCHQKHNKGRIFLPINIGKNLKISLRHYSSKLYLTVINIHIESAKSFSAESPSQNLTKNQYYSWKEIPGLREV